MVLVDPKKLAATKEAKIAGREAFVTRQRGKARNILREKHADLSDDAISALLDAVPAGKRLALGNLVNGVMWANEAEWIVRRRS
jgi:hypothetical protein